MTEVYYMLLVLETLLIDPAQGYTSHDVVMLV